MLVFTERWIYTLTLQTWHVVLIDNNKLKSSKDMTRLTVGVGAGIKETAKTFRTDLLTFFVELKCWYGGTIVTFTTSGAEVWKTLVEILTKTDLRTLRQSLTERLVLIFIYLIDKIKVTSFYNRIRRATDDLNKHRYTNKFTNSNKFTRRFSNNITDNFTWRDFSTIRNSFTHIFR